MNANGRKCRFLLPARLVRFVGLISALSLAITATWQICADGVRHLAAVLSREPVASGDVTVEDLVQDLAAVALVCAVGAVTAVLVLACADAVLGARLPGLHAVSLRLTPRACRHIVALCCGVGLAAPVYAAAPASADDGNWRHGCVSACVDPPPRLGGLALPDLPTGDWASPVQTRRHPGHAAGPRTGGPRLVVDVGDSLWSLAEQRLPADASNAAVLALSDRLYELNRAAIGVDPDLILPGTELRTPQGPS